MTKRLFNPLTRIHTKGVEYHISKDIINLLWSMIDELGMVNNIDYLHTFNFRIKRDNLVIEHRQEKPRYSKKHTINDINEVHKYNGVKVFVIDDYDFSIMMLASEY